MEPKLYDILRDKTETSINSKINELYQLINDKIMLKADDGKTKVLIFFPKYSFTKSYPTYDFISKQEYFEKLVEEPIQEGLQSKFQQEGIKIEFANARDKGTYIVIGAIVICKWDRDYSKEYSKESCTIC